MSIIKIISALWATAFPLRFVRNLNRQRISINIDNDPDGCWHVRIGALRECCEESLRRAVWAAFWLAERDPKFQWDTRKHIRRCLNELRRRC